MSKNKKNRGKHTKAKSKRREQEMTEMPSPTDFSQYKYTRVDSSEDDISGEDGRRLKVYIYDSELAKIKKWVLLYKNIETGGDLFGLWVDSHTAVVQFALGPGEKCRRYETSFFQDVEYLAKAGGYLTEKHGLCNLGQWHSHHQLSLNKPSTGDENTVWGHMPTLGLSRYIVCIANIIPKGWSAYDASVNCFLFELNDSEQLPVLKGEFQRLNQASPVNEHSEIAQVIAEGAEPVPDSDGKGSTHPSLWSKFKECICSDAGKAMVVLGVIAASLIVIGLVFLIRSEDNEPNY